MSYVIVFNDLTPYRGTPPVMRVRWYERDSIFDGYYAGDGNMGKYVANARQFSTGEQAKKALHSSKMKKYHSRHHKLNVLQIQLTWKDRLDYSAFLFVQRMNKLKFVLFYKHLWNFNWRWYCYRNGLDHKK